MHHVVSFGVTEDVADNFLCNPSSLYSNVLSSVWRGMFIEGSNSNSEAKG